MPGTASGPSGDGGVRPGLALISNECVNAGGGAYRRSQLSRFVQGLFGIARGGASQKFGSGGWAASATGAFGVLDIWRTIAPEASITSRLIGDDGLDASE